jgi:hypothetical protein
MTDLRAVALISAIPPTIIGLCNFVMQLLERKRNRENHKANTEAVNHLAGTVGVIEQNTNDMLSKLTAERNEAAKKANLAEGKLEGIRAEQERTTKGV